jgi:hypothetical protein
LEAEVAKGKRWATYQVLGRGQRSTGQTPSATGSQASWTSRNREGPLNAQEDVIQRQLYGVGEDRSNNKAKDLDRVRGQNSLQRPHFKTDSKSESKFAVMNTNSIIFAKTNFSQLTG